MWFYRVCSVRERAKVAFKWATVCNVPKFRLNNGKCYLLTAGFREYRVRTQGLISQVLILKPWKKWQVVVWTVMRKNTCWELNDSVKSFSSFCAAYPVEILK